MINEINGILKGTGFKVAGWIVTSTIVVVGAAYLYRQYLEMRKLKVDYMISQYDLYKAKRDNPDFKPEKSLLRKINKVLK
jgi:hypothetical protein